ncbi:MAG: 50S ribosomal protein L25 [Acidobacteria bacterium]|nr:50S ribosomal protein L25 [Acidobacteriota bacterium]
MSEMTLEVARREKTGSGAAKKLRRDGKIPAVVYGGDRDSMAITVGSRELTDLIRKGDHGIRSVFLLKLADSDQTRHAMIRDFQMDPISRRPTHIDFIRVNMDEKVHVTVPIHVTGTAKGVKQFGGILDFQLRELEVECLPADIPDEFVIDVTDMDINDVRRVSDLAIPPGAELYDVDEDRVVVSVAPKAIEEVEEPEEGIEEIAEPELIGRAKDEAEEKEEEED